MREDKPTEKAEDGFGLGLTRRDVLRGSAAVGVFGLVGVPAIGPVAANTGETLYLVENDENESHASILYSVELTGGQAVLTQIADLKTADTEFTRAHIAATPDGTKIYAIDAGTGRLGVYVVGGSFSVIGPIANYPGDVVLTTFSPGGVLYMASNSTEKLYTVDNYATSPSASVVGATGIDVQGADIAFTSDGTLYLYSNATSSLYTVDTTTGAATLVGPTGENFTGLAVRDNGTGDLVGSATSTDEIIVFDRSSGAAGNRYPMYLGGNRYTDYDFGDMTVGQLAPTTTTTTVDLCAGQDIDVGTATITQSTNELKVTYNVTGGWLLYETHVDVADSPDGFPTAGPGNPQVGNFDHSMTHDGVESFEYSGGCDYWGVNASGDNLYVAIHAVVKPTDGCVNFGALSPGDSVEGLGTVNPVLNIQSGYSDGNVLMSVDGSDPFYYGSDETPGKGGGRKNGCLDPAGFADIVATDASGQNRPHKYVFTVADDVSLSDFSLRMLDFGDYNPNNDSHHYAEMVAYDADGNVVDTHVLEYWSGGATNPTGWTSTSGGTLTGNLQDAGDACNAQEGEPGNWVWSVAGDGIVKVELTCGDGHDPNIAFTDLCFTANDETAWPCVDQDGVTRFTERGSWATYVTVESLLDCSNS